MSSAYLRLLIFLREILIPACVSSSPAFLMMYSAVPYKFLENRNKQSCTQFSGLRWWERAPAWILFSDSLQWLSSVTLYLKYYPFYCNWWNFILFNGRVIILLQIYMHAFLQIKYSCFTWNLGPLSPSRRLQSSGLSLWRPWQLAPKQGCGELSWQVDRVTVRTYRSR